MNDSVSSLYSSSTASSQNNPPSYYDVIHENNSSFPVSAVVTRSPKMQMISTYDPCYISESSEDEVIEAPFLSRKTDKRFFRTDDVFNQQFNVINSEIFRNSRGQQFVRNKSTVVLRLDLMVCFMLYLNCIKKLQKS